MTIRGKKNGDNVESGPWVQVSRLGMPLINEVIIRIAETDEWNEESPAGDSEFTHYYETPELAGLLPLLYLGVLPNLAGFPNGRRLTGNVVTIELPAIAGVTYQLVDGTFTADGAAAVIRDGTVGTARLPGPDLSGSEIEVRRLDDSERNARIAITGGVLATHDCR